MWREITGEEAPPSPVTAHDYATHSLPWFELYDENLGAVTATSTLANVKSVKHLDATKSALPLQDDEPVERISAIYARRRRWAWLDVVQTVSPARTTTCATKALL